MTTHTPPSLGGKYLTDSFHIADYPVLPEAVVDVAIDSMNDIRTGRYACVQPPIDSVWKKPGDDPNLLCKIEQSQFANQAIFDAVSHAGLGTLAARVTGASDTFKEKTREHV